MPARPFDIVLFGATGFTGRLVAEYVVSHAPASLKLAIAGRNQTKLDDVRLSMGELGARLEVVLADSTDDASLKKIAEAAHVIVSTVGPFMQLGLPLVRACAKAGTHYCDITGEVAFMRRAIDENDAEAKKTNARLVHTCGFDSIPSDLGMWALHDFLKRQNKDATLTRATMGVTRLKGGFSGGTIASMVNMLDDAKKDRSLRRQMADPYALSPQRDAEPELGRQRDLSSVQFDAFLDRWTAPFVMAAVNTRVVRRSNALLGYAYGKDLRYAEVSVMPRGLKGAVMGAGMTLGMGAVVGGLMWAPTRGLVLSRLPKQGEGPDEAARKAGGFTTKLVAENVRGERFTSTVIGTSDPGYGETAKMLGESALCLAQDGAKLPERFGVLTPATAMGGVLIERLRAAGMTFAVE